MYQADTGANMKKFQRIFIIGHPVAGKALLAKELAKALGWQFFDADLGIESRIGRHLEDILGQEGQQSFYDCQHKILNSLGTQTEIVVTTDGSVIGDEKNRQLLLNEFTVFLDVSTPVQLKRTSRNATPLLPHTHLQQFFDELHAKRDSFYQEVAKHTIHGDEGTLEDHVKAVINMLSSGNLPKQSLASTLEHTDLKFFDKERQKIITLTTS